MAAVPADTVLSAVHIPVYAAIMPLHTNMHGDVEVLAGAFRALSCGSVMYFFAICAALCGLMFLA